MTNIHRVVLFALLALPITLLAEDASTKAARQSMHGFVAGQMVGGTYYLYDPLESRLLALRFSEIHDEVRREGSFLVSCSRFTDQFGRSVDLDFLVLPKGGGFVTTQAIVHDIDGKARPYDLKVKAK
ncbi:MAG TPA: hypothetical protein VMT00_08995 [Thermoanaerobaculia bacterium]|nr:hypothetical protein [Thermoanaerobaculia bacterium]